MGENLTFQILSLASGGTHAAGPYVRICGRTVNDTSVSITVNDIKPYFWVKLRDSLVNFGVPNTLLIDGFVANLNDFLNKSVFKDNKYDLYRDGFTKQHKLVELDSVRKKFDYYGYSAEPFYYMKLKFGSARALTAARYALLSPFGDSAKKRNALFDKGFFKLLFPVDALKIEDFYRTKTMKGGINRFSFILAEANIAHENQLLADLYIQPGEWIAVQGLMPPAERQTSCNIELEYKLFYGELGQRITKKDNACCSPIRVLSWDLEVFCEPIGGSGAMKFYDGDDSKARILCVSAVSFNYGVTDSMQSVVFSLSEKDGEETAVATDDKTQVQLKWFTDESVMLRAFFDYIKILDPDIITGYNTERFDWLYLIKRCISLDLISEFDKLARWGKPKLNHDEKDAWNIIDIPGRIVHDMLLWCKRNKQYREYKLQYVCEENGLNGKDDVKYSDISTLFGTHAGRIKLAIYCELDSRLVCQLMQLKSLDPIGKTLGLSCITGVPPNDLLFRGSMNTLRCCLLRYAHRDDYVLSCPSYTDNKEPVIDDEEVETDGKFEGGKVLNPIRGFYDNPVVTLDFGSLYPSCMCELNICPSTSMTRAFAKENEIEFTQPPAPSLTGIWFLNGSRTAKCTESSEKTDKLEKGLNFYTYMTKKTIVAQYTDELNETIQFTDGTNANLIDGGYQLQFDDGIIWTRKDEDVLVFVDASVKEGTVPKIERNLKLDRKKAKKGLADAEARGDAAGAAFYDNLQNAIKVCMNALYGGLGSAKGGIFPNSAPLAAAITARGRSLIVEVKKNVESKFWLMPDGTCGGFEADNLKPEEGKMLRVLYGDTDSVMIDFPTCTLQQSAEHGARLSKWFGVNILQAPHVLEFEKVLFPAAFFKKKMYAAFKYEGDYSDTAKGKVFARGLPIVRRDNAVLIRETMVEVMKMMFQKQSAPEDIITFCGAALANIHNSAVCVYSDTKFEGQLPFDSFVQSAGISKELDEYDADNSATMIAKQLMITNPGAGLGKGVRVVFVVCAALANSKRCNQVFLPETALAQKKTLDAGFYVDALFKKLGPLLSCYFIKEEHAARMVKDVFGKVIELPPKRVADQNKLVGQSTAENRLMKSFRSNTLVQISSMPSFAAAAAKRGAEQQESGAIPATSTLQPVLKKQKTVQTGQKSMHAFFKRG